MIHILCEDNGTIIGTFADLTSAQTEAQSLATAYASGNPNYSTKDDGSTYYIVVNAMDMSH